jgi:hypothetical protein
MVLALTGLHRSVEALMKINCRESFWGSIVSGEYLRPLSACRLQQQFNDHLRQVGNFSILLICRVVAGW